MNTFTFFARDFFENSGEFDISAEHYAVLLRHCFRYGKYLSLVVYDQRSPMLSRLEPWRVLDLPFQTDNLYNIRMRRFYSACSEVHEIISSCNLLDYCGKLHYDCADSQVCMPEDPMFLREDGSIFFDSIVHEGEYSFYPRPDEDIGEVLQFGHWLPMDENGRAAAPAREHQLLPFPRSEIESDSFYLLLRKIQKTPCSYLRSATIQELDDFIESYWPEQFHDISPTRDPHVANTPLWYGGFRMYVLSACNALTNATVSEAFTQAGYGETEAYRKYFELLDDYVANTCPA